MDRRRLQLNALRAFEEVARQKSFRGAADALNVSQSSLSRHVAALEQSLGVALFDRLPRGLALTSAATTLLSAVGKSFDRLCMALDDIQAGNTQPRNLRIYFAPSFASLLGVGALSEFRQMCPDITLDITSLVAPQDMQNPPDAAVVYAKPLVSDKVTNLLWQVENTVVCRPEIAEAGSLISPAELGRFVSENELLHVRVETDNKYFLWQQFASLHDLKIEVERGLIFDTAELAIRYASSGSGIALLDPTPFQREIARGDLVCPTSLKLVLGYGYYLVCDAEALEDPAVALFRSWLIRQFSKTHRDRPE